MVPPPPKLLVAPQMRDPTWLRLRQKSAQASFHYRPGRQYALGGPAEVFHFFAGWPARGTVGLRYQATRKAHRPHYQVQIARAGRDSAVNAEPASAQAERNAVSWESERRSEEFIRRPAIGRQPNSRVGCQRKSGVVRSRRCTAESI